MVERKATEIEAAEIEAAEIEAGVSNDDTGSLDVPAQPAAAAS
jgi:hypothetical protein